MAMLVLLRHGESCWNAENRFTGWIDVELTPAGEAEARAAGSLLAEAAADGLELSHVHTSLLVRAIRSAELALQVAGRSYLPVQRHWRLNERHYGALQGLDKQATRVAYGDDQLQAWRRGYRTPPPPLPADDPSHPSFDPRYADVWPAALPATECLADVVDRLLPYFEDAIAPQLLAGRDVLVVAHGNSLRALMKVLEDISDEDIPSLNVPTGIPRSYRLGPHLELTEEPRYLGDEAAAAAAAAAVARQAGSR